MLYLAGWVSFRKFATICRALLQKMMIKYSLSVRHPVCDVRVAGTTLNATSVNMDEIHRVGMRHVTYSRVTSRIQPSVLQCVAVRCSALQCVAVRCSALLCVAVRCSALQCVAVCCSALQCVAVRCSVLQ